MDIFVSNLPFKYDDRDLREIFAPYGDVESARIINDRETGRSRGFGFVTMPDKAQAELAIKQLHMAERGGRELTVRESEPRPMRRDREGGGRRDGGNRDGGRPISRELSNNLARARGGRGRDDGEDW